MQEGRSIPLVEVPWIIESGPVVDGVTTGAIIIVATTLTAEGEWPRDRQHQRAVGADAAQVAEPLGHVAVGDWTTEPGADERAECDERLRGTGLFDAQAERPLEEGRQEEHQAEQCETECGVGKDQVAQAADPPDAAEALSEGVAVVGLAQERGEQRVPKPQVARSSRAGGAGVGSPPAVANWAICAETRLGRGRRTLGSCSDES